MIYGQKDDQLYVSPKQFKEWGAGERLDDFFTREPSRRVEDLNPRTLNGLLEVDQLKRAGIREVIDP